MIEPVFIGYKDAQGFPRAIGERAKHFAGRVSRYMGLRIKKNEDKKIAIVLHNSVCSGVEATVGQAFGMDAFESAVEILKRLKSDGYVVDPLPEDGKMLSDWLMERKAYSDFRWTSVEDIVQSKGSLYTMSLEEYLKFYEQLPKACLLPFPGGIPGSRPSPHGYTRPRENIPVYTCKLPGTDGEADIRGHGVFYRLHRYILPCDSPV